MRTLQKNNTISPPKEWGTQFDLTIFQREPLNAHSKAPSVSSKCSMYVSSKKQKKCDGHDELESMKETPISL